MNININVNHYVDQLYRRLDEQLLSLRSVLRSIESGGYAERGVLSENSPTNIAITRQINSSIAAQNEIRNAYCSIIRSFNDFIDELLAIRKLCSMPQKVDRDIHTKVELDEYISQQISMKAQKIGKDGHLSKPQKIAILGKLKKFLADAVDGYFDLRSTIEHHKGVAQKDIKMNLYHMEYLVGGKPMLLNKPTILKNTTIAVKTAEQSSLIKKGMKIEMTESEIEDIVQTIKLFVAPQIAKQAFTKE
ncbi:hypothetical protein HYW35_03530 [Candidatus Saccharibacteria bacterium]|nr:hypothetical protein [Candidatus Saccharibacteria bacterium]